VTLPDSQPLNIFSFHFIKSQNPTAFCAKTPKWGRVTDLSRFARCNPKFHAFSEAFFLRRSFLSCFKCPRSSFLNLGASSSEMGIRRPSKNS
jgi:hypothetical protein